MAEHLLQVQQTIWIFYMCTR